MSKQPHPAPSASAVGPCPTLIKISKVLEFNPAPSHHQTTLRTEESKLDRNESKMLIEFLSPLQDTLYKV